MSAPDRASGGLAPRVAIVHTRGVSDELQRIERLRARFGRADSGVTVGIGDDAAVLASDRRPQVLSVDVAVEGVHFRRTYLSWQDVGYRATTAALSDLAAMGATPRAALSSLILPPDVDDRTLDAMADGIAEAADACGATIVGGNLSRGSELSLTTTVVGRAPKRPLTRGGARAGDGLYVTGHLGAAALGLSWLEADRGTSDAAAPFVQRWQRPAARIEEGRAIAAGGATAAIDVSDGLLQDLGHLCAASGVGAEVECAALPLAAGCTALAERLGVDALDLALAGGEDYELLYAAPEGSVAATLGMRVGGFQDGSGVVIVDAQGRPRKAPEHPGFTHF